MKRCSKCKQLKPFIDFSKNKTCKDGYSHYCKQCQDQSICNWQIRNRIRSNKTALNFYHRNKERIRIKLREKYKNDDSFRMMHIKSTRNWEKENPEKCKLQDKRYYEKVKLNPMKYFNRIVGVRIGKSLKSNRNGHHWEMLVGYNLKQLKTHLEKRFEDGMTWGNYGEWHIDHIVPKSIFNFNNCKHIDFKRCWALSNLQPLWASENMIKHNKLEKPFQPSLLIG